MKNTQTPRVAIYCRVATESQLGMDSQKEHLTQHALSLGYTDLAYYGDNGASGLTLDRPGFRQMESDIKAGKINALLVKDISRIGRGYLQAMSWIKTIEERGIALNALDRPCILPTVAEIKGMYRAHTSRMREAQAQKRK